MKHCFIFCHGFGFDASFWDNLQPYFTKKYCFYLDLGYFNAENLSLPINSSFNFVGIGHSFGLQKLLSLPINFSRLIGIQSFTNFLGSNSILKIQRENDFNTLKQHFDRSPFLTLQNFYKRCGMNITQEKLKLANIDKLKIDLATLSHINTNDLSQPTLIIGAEDDVIVPMELINDNFNYQSNAHICFIKHGEHSLGYTQSQTIYQMITNFLNEVY